jgi:hypothetical protein
MELLVSGWMEPSVVYAVRHVGTWCLTISIFITERTQYASLLSATKPLAMEASHGFHTYGRSVRQELVVLLPDQPVCFRDGWAGQCRLNLLMWQAIQTVNAKDSLGGDQVCVPHTVDGIGSNRLALNDKCFPFIKTSSRRVPIINQEAFFTLSIV